MGFSIDSKKGSRMGPFGVSLMLYLLSPHHPIYTSRNPIFLSLRSYRVESTASRPLCEVKLHWAGLVLRWVTTGELSGVVSIFCTFRNFLEVGGSSCRRRPPCGFRVGLSHPSGALGKYFFEGKGGSRGWVVRIWTCFWPLPGGIGGF